MRYAASEKLQIIRLVEYQPEQAGDTVGWSSLVELELHWAWSWREWRGGGGVFVR